VNRARTHRNAKALQKRGGDSLERPAPLAQFTEQFRVRLKLASRWPGVGLGDEFGNLVMEAHASGTASTIRPCSALFGEYSVKIDHVRLILGGRPEWTRILPNGIRVRSALFGPAQSAHDILRLQKLLWVELTLTT
jgi:hypothetical protein